MINKMSIIKTLRLTDKTLKRLLDMSNKMEISSSQLFRMMINYFFKNPKKRSELTMGDYEND